VTDSVPGLSSVMSLRTLALQTHSRTHRHAHITRMPRQWHVTCAGGGTELTEALACVGRERVYVCCHQHLPFRKLCNAQHDPTPPLRCCVMGNLLSCMRYAPTRAVLCCVFVRSKLLGLAHTRTQPLIEFGTWCVLSPSLSGHS